MYNFLYIIGIRNRHLVLMNLTSLFGLTNKHDA